MSRPVPAKKTACVLSAILQLNWAWELLFCPSELQIMTSSEERVILSPVVSHLPGIPGRISYPSCWLFIFHLLAFFILCFLLVYTIFILRRGDKKDLPQKLVIVIDRALRGVYLNLDWMLSTAIVIIIKFGQRSVTGGGLNDSCESTLKGTHSKHVSES